MIRRATIHDLAQIADLAIEAIDPSSVPTLRIDRERIEVMVKDVVTSPKNFGMVSIRNGKIVGAVGVLVHDSLFFERMTASVLMFYCKAPGDGARMIRDFVRWAKGRPAIKQIVFSLEWDADPRIAKFLERMGFKNHPCFVLTK